MGGPSIGIVGTGWVGAGGAMRMLMPAMDGDEQARLARSAETLRRASATI
jgi:hypothetical protein